MFTPTPVGALLPLSEASVLVSIAEALLHQPQQTQQTFFIR